MALHLHLRDLNAALDFMGETASIELAPWAFELAQKEAGPELVFLEAGAFRFRSITVYERMPSRPSWPRS